MNDAVLQMWSRDMKIMQIKKLSKLVSQLNSTPMPVGRSMVSPVVSRQRKGRKESQGSDNDWGSDFEDSSDNRNTRGKPQIVQPTLVTAPASNTNTKISMNQVPKPYKTPRSDQRIEKIEGFLAAPEYSNIKKASLALKKSSVSTKVSTLEEKSKNIKEVTETKTKTKTPEKPLPKTSNRIKSSNGSISSTKRVENSSSMRNISNIKSPNGNAKYLKTVDKNIEDSKSPDPSDNMAFKDNVSKSSIEVKKKFESSNSHMSISNAKKSVNNTKSSLKHVNKTKSHIPPENSVVKPTVSNKSSNLLKKNAKENQSNSNESQAELEKLNGRVINNNSVKNKETNKLELESASNGAIVQPFEASAPSDKPAFIVHVDRASQKKDCQDEVKDSEVMIKTSEKKETKEASATAGKRIIRYIKTSNNFVKNNTEYATVKAEKVSTIAGSSHQPRSPTKAGGSKYLERALPLPPDEQPDATVLPASPPGHIVSPSPSQQPHSFLAPSSPRSVLRINQESSAPTPTIVPKPYQEESLEMESPSCQGSPLSQHPWYQAIDRRRAEQLVKQLNRDGGFVVRDSKHGGQGSPYTLTVYNNNKVFNINIRVRKDMMIALGKEKVDEEVYPSIERMVEHHTMHSLKLTAGDTGTQHSSTTLNYWPKKI